MARKLLAALVGVLIAGAAWAQRSPSGAPAPAVPAKSSSAPQRSAPAPEEDAQDSEEESEQQGEMEGSDVVEAEPGGTQIRTGKRDAAPGEVHTVVKGDTLWDLTQRFLGSPWYWPKVWSYNPQLSNPHWIYPGNEVRFFPSGEEVPTRVEVAGAGTDAGGKPPSQPEDREQMFSPDLLPVEDDHVRVTPGKALVYKPTTGPQVVHQGFVTKRELEEAGVIKASFAESYMLSYPDTAYVSFKRPGNAKVGERYVIFRPASDVVHPKSHRRVGYLTHLLGTMVITRVTGGLATGQVQSDTWDEVLRGDLIGPYSETLQETVAPRENARDLKGFIIGNLIPYLTTYGEHHVVIVDKGSADGVQTGNTFVIVRQHDPGVDTNALLWPAYHQDPKLPLEDVGRCMAINVKDSASMCLLMRSIREIMPGDRVEMRTGGHTPTASR